MNLREFVRVSTVNDFAKFAVKISKDEVPTPLLTVGLLFISVNQNGFCLFPCICHVSIS